MPSERPTREAMATTPMWTSNESLPIGSHTLRDRNGEVAYRVSVDPDGMATMTFPSRSEVPDAE